MKKLFAGLYRSASGVDPDAAQVEANSANQANTSDSPQRRTSILRRGIGRGGKTGSSQPDMIPSLIANAAATLADAIQEIIGDTAKLSGDNMSGYETLLCILNDTTELDEVAEVVKASGMGCVHLLTTNLQHPKFIDLCSPVSLAAGLFQALRLLRMYEIKQAKSAYEQALLAGSAAMNTAPSTFDASHKICKILEKLCSHSSTIEQVRTSLVKILTFPFCVLPLCGKHIQTHAAGVVLSICKTGFTSQQVWYLHDVQCITHMIRHLYELTSIASVSAVNTSPARPGSMALTETSVMTGSSTDYLLRGMAAEAEGMWITALECFVQVIASTVTIGSVLLNDFESAFGNKLFINILKTSSPKKFLHILNIITVLLFDPNKKEDETQQVLTTIACMLFDFLNEILGVATTIQLHDTMESLMDTCHGILTGAATSRITSCEYMIQGMAYSLLTMYSNEPIACVNLEESYHFLPLLLLSLPVLSHIEAMSAVLTTLNYVCQCIETPSKMIITALSAATSIIVQRFIEGNDLYGAGVGAEQSDHLLQQIELIFTSIEAVCRTNKAYVIMFMKVGLFKYILSDPFEKLHNELTTQSGPAVDVRYLSFYERIVLLIIDLNEKNSYAAEDIRRSNILLIIKKILLVYPLQPARPPPPSPSKGPTAPRASVVAAGLVAEKSRNVRFILVLMRIYEEISKVDAVHLQESVTILTSLMQELGPHYEKISFIFNTLWSICITNETYYKIFLKENTIELAMSSLQLAKDSFAGSGPANKELTARFQYISSILRFLSLVLFYAFENDALYNSNQYNEIYFQIAQRLLETGVFSSMAYKMSALVLVLKFITIFAYEQDIIYTKSLDILNVLLPSLPMDILQVLIQKLHGYIHSDMLKFKRVGDIQLLPKLMDSLTSFNKDVHSVFSKDFVMRCTRDNWHSESMLEILRSGVKKQILLNGANFSLSATPRPLEDALFEDSTDLYGINSTSKQSPFEEVPYIAIPLYETSQNESGIAASLAMFFNESTVPMPSAALTISCWIRIANNTDGSGSTKSEEGSTKINGLNTMIPIISLESAGSDIHLSIEINPMTADAVVLCTMGSDNAHSGRQNTNANNMEQDLIVFKPAIPLTIDSQHWTHCVISMKRVKRFTSSNQVQIALFFNGIPWIPHSNLSSTANNPNSNAQPGNLSNNAANNIGGLLSMDPLASSQNGEIRIGLPKDAVYHQQGKHSPEQAMQHQQVVLHVAALSIYNEQLQPKQIAMLFVHGPGYLRVQSTSDAPLSDNMSTTCIRALSITNELSKNALVYLDKLGLSGVEYVVEPRVDVHADLQQSVDMAALPSPVAVVHPFFAIPEHIALHGMTPSSGAAVNSSDSNDGDDSNLLIGSALNTKSRLSRHTLLNAVDLDNSSPLATLSAGGYLSKSMSVADCISSLGGADTIFPLLLYANTEELLCAALIAIRQHLINNSTMLKYMQVQGYRVISFIISNLPRRLITVRVIQLFLRFTVSSTHNRAGTDTLLLVDSAAMLYLILNHYVWGLKQYSVGVTILQFFKQLITDEKYSAVNIVKLSCLGATKWVLQLCLSMVQFHCVRGNVPDSMDVWIYDRKLAFELADYRDEPVLFIKLTMDIIRTVLQSELKARDLDMLVSTVLYTFLPSQNGSGGMCGRNPTDESLAASKPNNSEPSSPLSPEMTTRTRHSVRLEKRPSVSMQSLTEEEIQNSTPNAANCHLHPFCSYECLSEPTTEGDVPSEPRYLTALELFRVYLLRLLFGIYDDNLEELRRHNRRPSNPKSLNAKDLKELNTNPTSPTSGTAPNTSNVETEAFNIFRQVVPPHVLIGMLEQSTDAATSTYVLRLLTFLLQKDSIFNREFIAQKGYQVLYLYIDTKPQVEVPVLLPLISMLFRIPIQLLMHPYQIKNVDKVIQLVDLEESLGPNVQDIAVVESSVPMLYILYDCIQNIVLYYNNHNLGTANASTDQTLRWYNNMKDLLLFTIEYALDHCPSFKVLIQHIFSLEIHINTLLVCSNAFSEYGSYLYHGVNCLTELLMEDYLSTFEESAALGVSGSQPTVDDQNEQKVLDIEITNEIGHVLLNYLEKIFLIALREYENYKILYHALILYNTHIYSTNYEESYQLMIIKAFKKVLNQLVIQNSSNNHIDITLMTTINRNVLLLLPMIRSGYLHYQAIHALLETMMELFIKYTVVFKTLLASGKNVNTKLQSNVTLDMHQSVLKDINLNIRFMIVFALNAAANSSSASSTVGTASGNTHRFSILTFIKNHIEYIFYYIMDDSIEPNLMKHINTNKASILNNEGVVEKAMNNQFLETIANITTNTKNINKNLLASNVYINNVNATSVSNASSSANVYNNNPANYNTNINLNTYKLERQKVTNIFIIYLLHYAYLLVLEEDSNTRIQATRIISLLANMRKTCVEALLSNPNAVVTSQINAPSAPIVNNSAIYKANALWKSSLMYSEEVESRSPSTSPSPSPSGKRQTGSFRQENSASSINPSPGLLASSSSGVVDIYKDGIAKLIPNSSGQYDIDLRSGNVNQSNNEESRFADFSFWISEYTALCDKVFLILANVINNILPNFSYESEEFCKLSKYQLHISDLWTVLYHKDNMPSASNVTGGAVSGTNTNDNLLLTNIVNTNSYNHGIYNTITNANINVNNYTNNVLYNHIIAVYNNHADTLQNAIIRLYINNKIGERVIKMYLYWYREGIRDISIGGIAWKKGYNTMLAGNIWGLRRHSIDDVLTQASPLVDKVSVHNNPIYNKIYNNIYNVNKVAIYRLDYTLGPDQCRRKIVRDFTNYTNTFFANITSKAIIPAATASGATAVETSPVVHDLIDVAPNASSINLLLKQVKIQNVSKSAAQVNDNDNDDLDTSVNASMVLDEDDTSDHELEEGLDEDDKGNEEEALITSASGTVPFQAEANKPSSGNAPIAPSSSAPTSATATGAADKTLLSSTIEKSQYKSLMIKEILRGIIGSHELKKCQFYNIDRIFGLESQVGLLVLTPLNLHLISGFKCMSTDTTKVFSELAFDYTYHFQPKSQQPAVPDGRPVAVNKVDEKFINLNSIHNENVLAYSSSIYSPYNTILGEVYAASNAVQNVYQMCGEQAWVNEIWIEMLESEMFYDKIKIEDIHSFFKRRFQLRSAALEVADTRGHAVLFSCDTEEHCDEILTALLEHDLPSCIFNKLVGLKNIQLLRGANNIYHRLLHMFIQNITMLWQNNYLSNLEYLLYLNSAAGRSYLDLTQYPVFPWVVSDYTSEDLDLNDPETFRNLNVPMGCIGGKRKVQFVERYNMMTELNNTTDEEDGRDSIENIPFHYGTHYSCAGYVLYYLIRIQPYTNMYISLQDGHLDKADRLFYNIQASYNSAAHENLQDVRELTPEFYYMPNFLTNINKIHFGHTQKGEFIDHVVLPPWAKESAHMYIYKHRQALECKHVSENLNSWIDLIFGYKSRGKAAIQSINAFMRITYEDEIAIDEIEDPIIRNALVAQINNFGICAKQLFTKPHTKKFIPEVLKFITSTGGAGSGMNNENTVLVEPVALGWHAHLCPPLCVVGAAQFTILTKVSIQQVLLQFFVSYIALTFVCRQVM